MRKDEKASISTIKIIFITLLLILCSSVGVVIASNTKANSIKVIFPNDYELNIVTTKTRVSEILEDNQIVLLKNEIVEPNLEENVKQDGIIQISKVDNKKTEEVDEVKTLGMNEIKESYSTVLEKIVTLEVEIPFETITKDVSGLESQEEVTRVIQEGQNGLKVTTYKITYKNDIEVDRLELSSKIVKEPVNKIVEVNKKQVSRSGEDRTASVNPASTSVTSLASLVQNIEPKVITLNASAYTASTCGKTATDSGYGITASGTKAQAWYTVAAGKGYPIGTIMYIPYFQNKPNGGWFIVEDRGSAISNSKVDVYMDTYSECISFGRRNLECYIYEK